MSENRLNDVWARLVGIPLLAIVIIIFGDEFATSMSLERFLAKLLQDMIYVALYWHITRWLFIFMRKKYPLFRDTSKRISLQIVALFLLMLVCALIFGYINVYLLGDREKTLLPEFRNIMIKSCILLGLVTVVYECVYFFGRWKNSLIESERLKKENLVAQFELLKNQISPHFLFNSLNALIALVPENPDLSVQFIQRLSNVYRNVLSHNDQDLIGFSAEIDFLDDYVFLNKMRFGDNLQILYFLPADLTGFSIIPFTLQMLVENAIKHNIVSIRKPLTIRIEIVNEQIQVINNLQKKTSGLQSTKVGLINIINRYQLLSNRAVEIIETAEIFSVAVPLILQKPGI